MIDLSAGPKPDWELEEDFEDLNSISQSSVLAYSLRQSRERWLTSMFPKFSGKSSRGSKGTVDAAPVPPPHTIQTRGKCDVQLGPHVFTQTTFYEVHYLSLPATPRPPFVYPSTSSWPSTSSYTTSATSTPSAAVQTSAPLLSSVSSEALITPALINQVNAAASSNPTLANLLQLVAAGKASPEQLKTLGVLIQSLAASPIAAAQYSQMSTSTPSSTPPQPPYFQSTFQPTKEFDLVIEFREASFDRWVFPRGTTVCDRVSSKNASTFDIVITSHVPLGKVNNPPSTTTAEPLGQNEPRRELITMTLKEAPLAVWETLQRWIGGEEKMNLNRSALEKLKETQSRVYLGYRLPEGPLLSQLQAAVAPPYVLKPIKPSATSGYSRPRRARQRKQSEGNANTSAAKKKSVPDLTAKTPASSIATTTAATTPAPAANEGISVTGSETGPLVASTTPAPLPVLMLEPVPASASTAPAPAPSSSSRPPAPKKPRTSANGSNSAAAKKFKASPYQIRCTTCHQTDVPLMLGGRFCRSCVEAGRATVDIPQPLNYASRAPATYTPTYLPPPSNMSSNPYMALMIPPFSRPSNSPAPAQQSAINTPAVSASSTPPNPVPTTNVPEATTTEKAEPQAEKKSV